MISEGRELYRLRDENRQIRDMFSAISKRYDFLNRFLSFGQDAGWRRKAVGRVKKRDGGIHLDLACGTGDMGLEVIRQIEGAEVVGGDISLSMLQEAEAKVRGKDLSSRFMLVALAGEALPFKRKVFDSVLIAFGIRNVIDRELALREIARILRDDGTLVILEFSLPRGSLMRKIYLFYFRKVLPLLAGLFSERGAYTYLPESVLDFPERDLFMEMMRRSGFAQVSADELTFGIVTLYTGKIQYP